jgi:hypothetical protein
MNSKIALIPKFKGVKDKNSMGFLLATIPIKPVT